MGWPKLDTSHHIEAQRGVSRLTQIDLPSVGPQKGTDPMVEAVPNTYKLDEFLKDMIQSVYGACTTATAHLKDENPEVIDKAIDDCEEALGLIMEGKVDDWVE